MQLALSVFLKFNLGGAMSGEQGWGCQRCGCGDFCRCYENYGIEEKREESDEEERKQKLEKEKEQREKLEWLSSLSQDDREAYERDIRLKEELEAKRREMGMRDLEVKEKEYKRRQRIESFQFWIFTVFFSFLFLLLFYFFISFLHLVVWLVEHIGNVFNYIFHLF